MNCITVTFKVPFSNSEIELMVNAYKACALWSSISINEENEEEYSLDERYDFNDFTGYAAEIIEDDCKRFLALAYNQHLIDEDTDMELLGHNFWLNRNGHGAGFWDSPDIWGAKESKELDKLSQDFREAYIIELEDGRLDIM